MKNQTQSQSRIEINTHTEHLVQKHNIDLLFFNWKESYLVLNEEKRKQGNKKEKPTQSLIHLIMTVKMTRRSNYNLSWRKLHINKITAVKPQIKGRSTWKAYQLSTMIFHLQFNLAILFQRQDKFLLFTTKIIEMFELHASTQACQGCELLNIKRQ